ncbi:fructose-bisphosphate aldolase [Candidatus Bathyarchaeota archaeon]|nr:MAG: fructose-bisphosphate aldolase [Candidatus Bathyarchaeota archaeon]
MEAGITRRLRRIFRQDGRTVIIPMEHGTSVGPIPGLEKIAQTVDNLSKGSPDALLVHAGIAKTVRTDKMGLILHLSGATKLAGDPNWKIQVSTVRDAIRLGADAVSVQINIGSQHEQEMLHSFSKIREECDDYGIPVLGMMYPRGPGTSSEHAYEPVLHAARLGYELGSDIVQTNYTGGVESFRRIVKSVKVPVVITGGPKARSEREVLKTVSDSIKAGAAGISIGRNVFQQQHPALMTRALVSIVHGNKTPSQALKVVGGSRERNPPGA